MVASAASLALMADQPHLSRKPRNTKSNTVTYLYATLEPNLVYYVLKKEDVKWQQARYTKRIRNYPSLAYTPPTEKTAGSDASIASKHLGGEQTL